jgi:hypothetical protein
MSLQLSKSKPRQLQYAVGGLREDFKLIEVDEKLLDAITNDQCVCSVSAVSAKARSMHSSKA